MSKLTALGIHVYAGGHTLGVLDAGFKVLGHLEEWTFGTETVKKNLGLECRIGPENWHVEDYAKKVDWVYSNPPCASWSQAGVKVKNKEHNVERYKHDGRTQCTELCFAQVPLIQPTVYSWESVAAATTNGREFVSDRTKYMNDLGYHVYQVLFNGRDCGLPQNRRRFFFVGSKVKMNFTRPNEPHTTVREAWANLSLREPVKAPKISQAMKELLQRAPKNKGSHLAKLWMKEHEGKILKRTKTTGYVTGRPSFLAARVPYDGLAPTVTGGAHLYHPTQARSLTVKEQQLLCGYPKDYQFVGSPGACFAQIAKAVLPPPAYWLARQVKKGLQKHEKVKPGLTVCDFLHEAA